MGYRRGKKKYKKHYSKDKYDKGGSHHDDGDRGDYHDGGYALTKLMVWCQKVVTAKLKWGKFSEKSISDSMKIIDKFKAKIDAKMSKWVKADEEAIAVTVQAKAAATGEHARTDANVKLAILDGDGYKLAIGTAQSYAGSDSGESFASTFSGVKGVDTASIHSYSRKGSNYEKAVECLVAIDWEDIYDKNIIFTRHHSSHSRIKKEVGEGKLATASAFAVADGDSSTAVESIASTLAVDDFLASGAHAYGEAL
ncbi:hypothetical protein [Tropicimonas marinistellae]|uniref:hypothetical protein n=1 Tax=Tropicimonas marinistellae TaxID=1739787 RepID=UPI00082AAC87|nr:hypothetical protein [Tropicimonas marinistellae]